MVVDGRVGSLPLTTVQRLPRYLRVLRAFQEGGVTLASSARLAGLLQLEAIQVRKDFGYLGITGKPNAGFQVSELIEGIERCLNWNRVSDAILVGAGHLGTALLGYQGFAHHGMRICAAFDIDPGRVGTLVHGVPVRHLDELESCLPGLEAAMAILAVSPESAQAVCDRMLRAGIAGVWNFTGCTLQHPDHAIVQNEDIAVGLAVLSAKLNARTGKALAAAAGPLS